jgi:TolB-like protein/Flp pilus assembly protein TadD
MRTVAPKNFFAELKRRNVIRAAILYVGAAWALAQGISQLGPSVGAPEWATRWFLVAAVIGFPFALVLSWFYEFTPEGLKRESEIDRAESITRRTGRKLDFAIIGVLAIAVVLLLTDRFVLRHGVNQTTAAPISEKSIAVLPLMNSTGDPANEYFSDGMSEEFISSLSRLQELKVVGRTSSFQFKGKTDDSKTIGEKLGVYYLLEGSVRKSADRVRIAVALIKSGDGANVWSVTYDRELKDIFAVQSEIAGAVAKQLKVALLRNNGQAAQLTTAATPSNQNVEAYNALLQGNFYFERRTAEDLRKAIGYYEEAIRLDPRYALANANLSRAARSLVNGYVSIATKEGQEAIAKARASAQSAFGLDPNLAEAHLAQGAILELVDFNFTEAEAELRRALELAPQNPAVISSLANLMSILGRFDEAVALAQRAITIDPLRIQSHSNLANYLIALGRYDEAEAGVRKAIALQPQSASNYERLAVIHILRGDPGAAVKLAKQETDPFWRTFGLAQAHFANSNRPEADAALKKLIDEDADDAGSQIAEVYALRKEPEKMFEWLEHGWTTHDAGVTELLFNPFLLTYKDDPRFIAFGKDRRDAESHRQMNRGSFFSELKRRNAIRAAILFISSTFTDKFPRTVTGLDVWAPWLRRAPPPGAGSSGSRSLRSGGGIELPSSTLRRPLDAQCLRN